MSAAPSSEAGAVAPSMAACAAPAPVRSTSLASTPVTDPLVTFDSAWAIIARSHWDTTYNGVNWGALRDSLRPKAAAAKTTGELRGVLSAMVGSLRQSHFSIIPREVSDPATTAATSAGSRAATAGSADPSGVIGATLRYVDERIVVSEVVPGGAAARAGVRPGWVLESVQGCPVANRLARIPADPDARRMALAAFSAATQLLAGPAGDTVAATFLDGTGTARAARLVRDVDAGTVTKFGNLPAMSALLSWERVRHDGRTIGIIRFNIWMPVLSPLFDAAIDSLRGADAIVLDIRGNFGGVGGMSMGVAGHFLDSAYTIGTMKMRAQSLNFVANPRRVDTRAQRVTPFAGPVALLVDELSISTTEIFAGGLQALGRARVFGSQTSGQALPSVPERLPNGDILYHAIADFLSPVGKPLEGAGVTPDEITPVTRRALLAGKDPARDAALAWAARAAAMPRKGATP